MKERRAEQSRQSGGVKGKGREGAGRAVGYAHASSGSSTDHCGLLHSPMVCTHDGGESFSCVSVAVLELHVTADAQGVNV